MSVYREMGPRAEDGVAARALRWAYCARRWPILFALWRWRVTVADRDALKQENRRLRRRLAEIRDLAAD